MKVCFISDTHGYHTTMEHPIPECDLLVSAGDVSAYGHVSELWDFCSWMTDYADECIIVAGNHDRCFEVYPEECRTICESFSVHYLEDESVVIDDIVFYGSPWTPEFFDWHFMLPRNGKEIWQKWDMIPQGVDVLITHGPPNGILDLNGQGVYCGCERLREEVVFHKRPRYHVFGHIHESYGYVDRRDIGMKFLNVSICDAVYRPVNKPVLEEIEAR